MKNPRFYYHLFTALLFLGMAVFIWLSPNSLGTLSGGLRYLFIFMLMLWGIFRGMNAWFIWKKNKREQNEVSE